jgi:hypothetical protein
MCLYLAYLQRTMIKKKRGVPELNLNTPLSSWVEGSGRKLNFFNDINDTVTKLKQLDIGSIDK